MPVHTVTLSQELGQLINDIAEARDWDLGDVLYQYVLQGFYSVANYIGDPFVFHVISHDWAVFCRAKGIPCEFEDVATGVIERVEPR